VVYDLPMNENTKTSGFGSISSRLRAFRLQKGLTLEEFGGVLGLRPSAMGKHERGDSYPTTKMLRILAIEYNLSMDYMICGRGSMYYNESQSPQPNPVPSPDHEVTELFDLMAEIPLVRLSMLTYFQRFKIENKELLKKALSEKDQGLF
jgi:transcriptional regulator with XRE-family HTH domain